MSQEALFETHEAGGDEDFWPTPDAVTLLLKDILPKHMLDSPRALVEPCAGIGMMASCVAARVMLHCRQILAYEVDSRRAAQASILLGSFADATVHAGDFLKIGMRPSTKLPVLWVTNPPYSKPRRTIGEEIAVRCLELAGPNDVVAMLMPLDFATGAGRTASLHRRFSGGYLYPLRTRPRFANGETGKRPVAWFVWDRGYTSLDPTWRVIG
jgi:hypothetical protein